MFKTEVMAMTYPNAYSAQRDWFYGAIGLLAVSAVTCAAAGSALGFLAIAALIGVLCTRAQWARILTLVITAYVGLVALLVAIFAHGPTSFSSFVMALICGAIFWILLRPGMDRYFGASPRPVSQVLPVPPRPGALPHLQQTAPPAASSQPAVRAASGGNTQQQWERLQQQLRAEREKEAQDAAAGSEADASTAPFPWLALVFTVFVYAYAASVGGDLGKLTLLLAIPGFIAAMLRWIHPRGFLLGTLLVSGALIVTPEWSIVAPAVQVLLHHHGPLVLAGVALLGYLIALYSSGVAGDCEDHV
jgi:hypothetical protein